MTDAPGEFLVRQLTMTHDMIRRDLEAVRRLAGRTAAGAAPDDIRTGIHTLQTQGPLWRLRVDCLRHCFFVHSHHGHESALLFPALRRSDPALGPVVDRLEADHRVVSDLLDGIEAVAHQLEAEPDVRPKLAAALDDLATHLLTHLAFEEESISPTLRRWHHWPL